MEASTLLRGTRLWIVTVSLLGCPLLHAFSFSLLPRGVLPHGQTASTCLAMIAPQQLGEFEVLQFEDPNRPTQRRRRVALLDLTSTASPNSMVPFETAWDWQKKLLDGQVQRIATSTKGDDNQTTIPQFLEESSYQHRSVLSGLDTILMLQHEPVYTLGTGSDEKFVLSDQQNSDDGSNHVPVVRMDRGGEVTYHGPGQLTIYPVLDLRGYKQDIHWYMRALEEAILLALTKKCGLNAERQSDITGVWVDNCKVAAVGIKVKKWVSMHGLAVNVEASSLEHFQGIVPCGLEGRRVGCINQFLEENGEESITVAVFAEYMKEALEQVFQIELIARTERL